MNDDKLNGRINLPVAELEEKLGHRVNGELPGYQVIVSPRELKDVRKVCVMGRELLKSLIHNIPLRDQGEIFPYKGSEIESISCEPRGFMIGQTFVLDRKVRELMIDLPRKILSGLCLGGVASAPPLEIYGSDYNGRFAIAFYVPPIVEYHNNRPVILDGIHRSFLSKGAGATQNAIHVFNPTQRLPFEPITWTECSLMDEKPEKSMRYNGLDGSLYRDLGMVGIDG